VEDSKKEVLKRVKNTTKEEKEKNTTKEKEEMKKDPKN
jgi:hypothetical protein